MLWHLEATQLGDGALAIPAGYALSQRSMHFHHLDPSPDIIFTTLCSSDPETPLG